MPNCQKCGVIAPNNHTQVEEWSLEFPNREIFLCKDCAIRACNVLIDWLADSSEPLETEKIILNSLKNWGYDNIYKLVETIKTEFLGCEESPTLTPQSTLDKGLEEHCFPPEPTPSPSTWKPNDMIDLFKVNETVCNNKEKIEALEQQLEKNWAYTEILEATVAQLQDKLSKCMLTIDLQEKVQRLEEDAFTQSEINNNLLEKVQQLENYVKYDTDSPLLIRLKSVDDIIEQLKCCGNCGLKKTCVIQDNRDVCDGWEPRTEGEL